MQLLLLVATFYNGILALSIFLSLWSNLTSGVTPGGAVRFSPSPVSQVLSLFSLLPKKGILLNLVIQSRFCSKGTVA
jgi:hypothetical protein